jgi:outer membrane protein assembly factor BamB
MATPLLYEGHLYVLEQHLGLVTCYDARTGKQVYRERLPQARGFFASPWACAGRVFCLDEDGQTFVLQAGPGFKVVGRNKLGETCWASPALAGDALFLRSIDHLYCIRNKP